MTAAVDHLVAVGGDRPVVAILGDMYELGPGSEAFHRGVGEHCASLVERVVAVGELAGAYLTGAPDERWFATGKMPGGVPVPLREGSAILVKAHASCAWSGLPGRSWTCPEEDHA
jgi:UDP-N-acetylmuramoyl-tripeptide--D-alanyl-D-alanine ligase